MATHSRIGKGLTALLGENNEQESNNSTEIAIDLLSPNPWQPRQQFNEESLTELAESIKNQGIIQPLLVREVGDAMYQIIAGERRWRAAKIAGLRTVPVYLRTMTDEEVMTAALIENLQREDLNPIEEAQALQKLRETLNVTQEVLATRIGRSRSSVANALRLLQLSSEAQADVRNGILTAGHARTFLAITDPAIAEKVRQYVITNELSVRDTETLIGAWKKEGQAPWNDRDQQGDEESKQEGKKKRERTRNEIAEKMQAVLTEILNVKTRVLGTEEKGKIILSYHNSQELKNLLEQLGATQREKERGIAEKKDENQ